MAIKKNTSKSGSEGAIAPTGCCEILLNGGSIKFRNLTQQECQVKLQQQGGTGMNFTPGKDCTSGSH